MLKRERKEMKRKMIILFIIIIQVTRLSNIVELGLTSLKNFNPHTIYDINL